ncbi:MAG TPA: amidohydrolase family protein [Candidatus Binatia bacterium]|nr:amidohydrolase family protein [Candidatus Binatia bacterium]
MGNYKVIDADGHVRESVTGMREFLEPRWQRRNLFPNDAWDRDLRGKLGAKPNGPEDQLAAMDEDGIDVMVLYPTAGLHVGSLHELDFATAVSRAYNDWIYHFCKKDPARLKFVAVLAPQNPQAAAAELERAVIERGAVAGVLPTYLPQRPDFGDSLYDPIYATAERLGVGLGFHTGTSADSLGALRFRKFLSAHTIDHPAEQMMAMIATVVGGVFDRFPQLSIAYLESGIGWVPYMMDRLDEEVEKRGADEAPYLTKPPSEYVTSGRIFFGVECGEKTIPDGVRWGLESTLLYSSDYPHWDGDWPHTVKAVRERQDLTESTKQKMLHDNVARFYNLPDRG